MSKICFNIEFAGELRAGTDPAKARADLQTRLGLSDRGIAELFSGAPVTVKRGVDGATAARLHAAFEQAGAVARVIPVHGERAQGQPPPSHASQRTSLGEPDGPASPQRAHARADRVFHWFEKKLALVLLVLISAVAVEAVVALCVVLYQDLTSSGGPPLLDQDQLFEVFGMFLVVLIAVELMASIYMYMMDKSVHVEIMLLIAITALTRKVVVLDTESKGDPALYMLGLAALLATLIGGFYLIKRLERD
nr:phosphate-starvation-inducible PsiE family protein [Thiorhodococcus minor]